MKMSCGGFLLFVLMAVTAATLTAAAGGSAKPSRYSVPFNRTLFPHDFLFGAGSSAYQYEGAVAIDGRAPSIWDTFTKHHPEKIQDHSTGDVAEDFYHHYKTDIRLMKKIGLDSFRFSISWSRIFPDGRGKVNDLGVKFYNNVINELLANGLIPFVTIFHWDLPQALEDEYGGFLSPKIVDDFQEYANLCFKTFGDRVKNWVTLNEPSIFIHGYTDGKTPPGRCSNYAGNCTAGDSAIEPYLVTHHLLISHAAVVRLYRTKYQAAQKGKIGMTLTTEWMVPKSETAANREAANRALDFYFGWHANPITYGDYPQIMKALVGDRLPKFSKSESEMLKGSYDFLGINYYTALYAENSHNSTSTVNNKSYASDTHVTFSTTRNGHSIGTQTVLSWLYVYPKGLHQLLVYVKNKYQNPPIYITENGIAEANNASKPVQEAIKDSIRIRYHDSHLRSLLQAIKDGVNVKGYYAWSFLDDFEWYTGYTVRFGLTYVDYKNELKRYLKYSAYWFKMFLLR